MTFHGPDCVCVISSYKVKEPDRACTGKVSLAEKYAADGNWGECMSGRGEKDMGIISLWLCVFECIVTVLMCSFIDPYSHIQALLKSEVTLLNSTTTTWTNTITPHCLLQLIFAWVIINWDWVLIWLLFSISKFVIIIMQRWWVKSREKNKNFHHLVLLGSGGRHWYTDLTFLFLICRLLVYDNWHAKLPAVLYAKLFGCLNEQL